MSESKTIGDLVASVLMDSVLRRPKQQILVPLDFDDKSFIYDLTTNAFGPEFPWEELDRARSIVDRAIKQGDDARTAAGRAWSYLSKYYFPQEESEEDPQG